MPDTRRDWDECRCAGCRLPKSAALSPSTGDWIHNPPVVGDVPRRNRRSALGHVLPATPTAEHGIGDLKLFELKTICPFIAVRDCGER